MNESSKILENLTMNQLELIIERIVQKTYKKKIITMIIKIY